MHEFITSSQAAKEYAVTNDYIARLCRQHKLNGILEGRVWLVEKKTLEDFFKNNRDHAASAPNSADAYISSRAAADMYRVTTEYISRL